MSGTQGMHMAGAEETAKQFWSHRPRRAVRGRKIAGVAAGIGNHYRIDPVIVRVALVATSLFGGAGLLLYLLGWLLLPQEGDEVSPFESMIGRGRSATSTGFTVLLCLALFPAGSWFFGGSWFWGGGFSGILGVALLLGGLYLLQKHRGETAQVARQPAAAAAMDTAEGSTMASEASGVSNPPSPGQDIGDEPRTTPPAWDPLGAAPFAWDLPDPTPPPPPPPARRPRKRRSKVTLVSLGIALIAVALCVAMAPLSGGWITTPHVIGIVVAVLGLGMVAGSFVRGGRGLLGPALALATVGVIATSAGSHLDRLTSGGLGDREYAPTTVASVQPVYDSTEAGNITLDLRRLPNSGTVRTSVQDTFGDVTVRVPRNADVTAECRSGAGSVDCLDQHQDGINAKNRAVDYDVDGPGGLKIDLTVRTAAGNVEVTRG